MGTIVEQHKFELSRSTYTQIFFFVKYYSTYTICGWLNPQTTEPQIRSADSKVICGFWTAQRVSILNPCAVEASVAFVSPLNR